MSEQHAKDALAAFNDGKIDVFYSISARYIASYVSDLEARLEKAEAERDAAHAWIKDATTKITGLTAGGSEYFTKHGDAYWADIDFCVTRIRERYETSHGQVIKAHKRASAARNDALEEAAKAIEAQLPFGHEKGARWNLDGLNKLARTAALIRDLKDGSNGEA